MLFSLVRLIGFFLFFFLLALYLLVVTILDIRRSFARTQTSLKTMNSATDIFNGARCKSYSWSQSHGDLEIKIQLDKSVRQEDIHVDIMRQSICVEASTNAAVIYDPCCPFETLVQGEFEHPIDTDSVYWLIESEPSQNQLLIYMDKSEDLWWKRLLVGEESVEPGSRNYTISLEQLDSSSHMVVDRLIREQQSKANSDRVTHSSSNYDSPV